jgi:hypothetical protein
MHLRRAFVTLAVLTAAGTLRAQATDPRAVQPERPTVATHAGTVARGFLEVETGIERDRAGGENSFLTPTILKFGIADRMQLGVFGASVRPAGAQLGIGDVGAGLKARLVDDAPVVGDFALLPSVKFPTGSSSRGTGTGTTDLSLLAISSHALGAVSMDINAGYTHRSGDGSNAPTSATVWTLSFGGPAVGSVGWVAEAYGYPGTSGPAGQRPIVAFLAGPTWLVQRALALDAGVIVRIAGPQPSALYAGAVYNVGRLWGATR